MEYFENHFPASEKGDAHEGIMNDGIGISVRGYYI
jgi:hypothetical protein